MRIVEYMAAIKAIKGTSKRYHWQCKGANFNGDHLLFDRVADTFSEDYVDTLAEIWYMADGRNNIMDLNDLAQLTNEKEGYKFSLEELKSLKDLNTRMAKILLDMVSKFTTYLTTGEYNQGVSNLFDEISQKANQIKGLLEARVDINKPMSEAAYRVVSKTLLK